MRSYRKEFVSLLTNKGIKMTVYDLIHTILKVTFIILATISFCYIAIDALVTTVYWICGLFHKEEEEDK